jgi:hypothetical protein
MNQLHRLQISRYDISVCNASGQYTVICNSISLTSTTKGKSIFEYILYVHDVISIYTCNNERPCLLQNVFAATNNTLLAPEIITSNRFYCINKQRLNNILIYFSNFMDCDVNSFNFKNVRNLARYKCKTS